MNRTAKWISEAVDGGLIGVDVLVSGVAQTDSRECSDGDIFIARVGETSDGHDYAMMAVQNGAVCIVAEHSLPDVQAAQIIVEDSTVALGVLAKKYLADLRKDGDIEVFGITGSAGKTTTKDLLGQILSEQAPCVFPVLSFNNEVGCPLTILRADEMTRYLVLEMGASGAGHLRYLTNIAPLDFASVLMVGVAHLGGFGSPEALALAKRELIEGLLPTGTAILNADDPQVLNMADVAPGPVTYFSALGEPVDLPGIDSAVWAKSVELSDAGCPRVIVGARVGSITSTAEVEIPLVGSHQVTNGLAALAMALSAGLSLEQAAHALNHASRLSPHRMVVHAPGEVGVSEDVLVIDDSYNANPDSMRAGLQSAKDIIKGRPLIAVLGEMLELGDDAADEHERVGKLVRDLDVNVAIAVGEHAGAVAEGSGDITTYVVDTHEEAQEILLRVVSDHSAIFIKGSAGSNVWRIADAITGKADL